jgi:hypothetical protein
MCVTPACRGQATACGGTPTDACRLLTRRMGKASLRLNGNERRPDARRRGTLIACPAVWAAAVVFAGSARVGTSVSVRRGIDER